MIQDTRIQVNHLFSTSGASNTYVRVPYDCVLEDVHTTLQGDPGDSDTLTVTENADSTALGAVAFGDDVSAGDVGTYTPDSTTGRHVLAAGEVLKIAGSTSDAAVNVLVDIELDPYARTTA